MTHIWRNIGILILLLTILAGCRDKHISLDKDYSLLEKYHEAQFPPENANGNQIGKIAMYLDYSGSMYQAISQNYDLFQTILSMLDKEGSSFYRIGAGQGASITITDILHNPNSPYYALNVSSFNDNQSKLREALAQISRKEQEAIFITDFELYEANNSTQRPGCDGKMATTPINVSNWQTPYFSDWLSKGHSIQFIALPFTQSGKYSPDGVQRQRIYFTFFTPKNTPQSLYNKVKARYNNLAASTLDFNTTNYQFNIQTQGKPETEKALGSQLEFQDYYQGKGFDYYQMVKKDIQSAMEDEEFAESRILFEGIEFLNQMECYPNYQIGLQAYDITEAFQTELKRLESEDTLQHLTWAPPKPEGEIFELKAIQGQEKFAVKIQDLKSLPIRSKLYRIDFELKEATLQLPLAKMENLLTWNDYQYTKCMPVKSLMGSLQEAMARISITNRHLYTIYIEILN